MDNDEKLRKEAISYVTRKNDELNLGISNMDMSLIAELYLNELSSVVDRYVNDDFVENDLLLIDVVSDYLKDLDQEVIDEMAYDLEEDKYNRRFAQERAQNAHGGYGYSESFDDQGFDESNGHMRR